MDKRLFLQSLGAAVALVAGGDVLAQTAARPIRVVVPLAVGTSNDFVARTIAQYMSVGLAQTMVIDNKAGANGIIGTMDVVKSAPDGHNLLVASVSPLAINMALYSNVPYVPARDLTPIAGVSLTNNVLLVNAAHPAKTFAEFLDYAKKNPRSVNIGSSTAATELQIQTMNRMAGTDMQVVSYKGAPAAINDVIGGSLTAVLADPGLSLTQTKGGRLRALAVSSLKRNPITPDWPAMSETLPGFDFTFWNILVGPAGLSREAVNRLNGAANAALKQKDVVDKFAQSGTIPLMMSPEEVKGLLVSEAAKWAKLAKDANIKPELVQ